MIITCPECATRYDIDDERFTPKGRSVRCTACGESWFVPPPEAIEALSSADRVIEADGAEESDDAPKSKRGGRLKVSIDEREAKKSARKGRRATPRAKAAEKSEADADEDDDDALFDSPILTATRKTKAAQAKAKAKDRRAADINDEHDDDDERPPQGWRKGRQFFVRDEDEDEDEDERPRSFFARRREDDEDEAPRRRRVRDALRFDNEVIAPEDDNDFDLEDVDDEEYEAGEAAIVDADWEDVGDYGEAQRGFGKRVRAERRRATALARMEDVRRFDPQMFDEEFFASLRVTPRELERAVRKARRRAEARDKNRLTPLRAFGWSAWVAAVAGVAYAVVVYREDIVKMAPPAADAYAVIGIEADPYGLKIENVRHRLAMSTGGPTIEITGELQNEGAHEVAAPLLQAEALGTRGALLSRWTFSPAEPAVSGGGFVEFTTRAPAPEGVSEVALSFAPEKSVVTDLLTGGE